MVAWVWQHKAHRLQIVGSDIFVPGHPTPVILRGFDLMFKHGTEGMDRLTRQDRMLKSLVPGVSLVRLIVNHWNDDVTSGTDADCYDEGVDGFVREACLDMFDEIVEWATQDLQSWAIVTARSALAAGDGGTGHTIFDNATLRNRWVQMWGALARRYSSTDRVAGYEVMSEPRSYASAGAIHSAQQQACNAIWLQDPDAICVVGAARFYNRFHLNASYVVEGGPVLYAANFFAPRSWVSTHVDPMTPNASYPGDFACCDLYQKDLMRRREQCGGIDGIACNQAPPVRADRSWLVDQLRSILDFRDRHKVPVWIDQWGVRADAIGGVASQQQYLSDILDVLNEAKLHWTYWIWRRTSKPPDWTCDGFAVACQQENGNYYLNELLLHHLSRAIASQNDHDTNKPGEIVHAAPREQSFSSTVVVGANQGHKLPRELYSMFLESEINFGGEGGLYAELIRNRDFEALGRGCVSNACDQTPPWERPPLSATLEFDAHEPSPSPSDHRPWGVVGSEDKIRIGIDRAVGAPFPRNPNTLRVDCLDDTCLNMGVQNPGYWGIAARVGSAFNLRLFARVEPRSPPLKLVAKLVEGSRTLAEGVLEPSIEKSHAASVANGWRQYHATLVAVDSAKVAASFHLVLADGPQPSTFWLDSVSLFPADAVGGLFRRDLFEKLRALNPGFVRLPGGNYLEGFGHRTRWKWKETLGHWAARPGHYNTAWGYWVTDGFGLFEMLRFCELLGVTCQLSIYSGYSMKAPYVPLSQSMVFAQDALDLLEFARSDSPTSHYASMRRDMGHTEPFLLNRVEVGNEERVLTQEGYAGHYKLITQELWAKYPDLVIIASGRWRSGDLRESSPCLTDFEMRCDAIDEHFYQTPDEMASMASEYDAYNRDWRYFSRTVGRKCCPGCAEYRRCHSEACKLRL